MNAIKLSKTLGIVLVTSAVLLYGLAYYVYAGHGYGFLSSHLSEEMTEWVTEHLELTEDQRNKFEEYRKEIYAEVMKIHDSGIELHKEMMAQLEDEEKNFSYDALSTTVNDYKVKLSDLTGLVVKRFGDFYNELTPEQRVKFNETLNNFGMSHCYDKA